MTLTNCCFVIFSVYIYISLLLGQVAQSVEQRTENPRVGGSIPSLTTLQPSSTRRSFISMFVAQEPFSSFIFQNQTLLSTSTSSHARCRSRVLRRYIEILVRLIVPSQNARLVVPTDSCRFSCRELVLLMKVSRLRKTASPLRSTLIGNAMMPFSQFCPLPNGRSRHIYHRL